MAMKKILNSQTRVLECLFGLPSGQNINIKNFKKYRICSQISDLYVQALFTNKKRVKICGFLAVQRWQRVTM